MNANEQSLYKAALAVAPLLQEDDNFPEPSHPGICTPETPCDTNCQEISYQADRNARIKKFHRALKAYQE